MEAIQQARKLFLKCHHHETSLTESDKLQLKRDIQRFIAIAIKEATSKDLFENMSVLGILKQALKQKANENSDVMPIARAFQSLEKYFLLLVEQPWKPEFKEIKMYGGFYRTRVKSVLPDCESIFEQAGYMILPESSTMIFKGPLNKVNKTLLLLLAFDCRVGQVECETIAEHYNKIKGLSMSMGDAISNILHDEYTRDKSITNYQTDRSDSLIGNMSHISAPPALPKREPIAANLISRQNGRCELENGVGSDFMLNSNGKFETGINLPLKSSSRTSDSYSSVLTRPPMAHSRIPSEPVTYVNAQRTEFLPDLPQGTSEEHMWESLRRVHLQEAQRHTAADAWNQDNSYNTDIKALNSSNHPNFAVPTAYSVNGLNSPVISGHSYYKPAQSLDEGIELDLPQPKSYTQSTKFGPVVGHQSALPNRSHYQQQPFEQSYRITTPDFMYRTLLPCSSSSNNNNTKPSIYQSNLVVTDGYNQDLLNKSVVSNVPPPIPSRALKPKPANDEESLRNKFYMSAPHYTSSNPTEVALFHNELTTNQPPISAPGYFTFPQSVKMEPVLRRDHRLAHAKTSSLKVGGVVTPLSQQTARAARSMDISAASWECQSCTTMNLASSSICFACSHSRLGPDISHPVIGETKKECPSCTYVNNPNMTYCEMCGSKLNDKFTCV